MAQHIAEGSRMSLRECFLYAAITLQTPGCIVRGAFSPHLRDESDHIPLNQPKHLEEQLPPPKGWWLEVE